LVNFESEEVLQEKHDEREKELSF